MEPIVSSETSAIRTQTPGNYPKRNNLQVFFYYTNIITLSSHIFLNALSSVIFIPILRSRDGPQSTPIKKKSYTTIVCNFILRLRKSR